MIAEFLLFSITLAMTTCFIFMFVFDRTQRLGTNANVILTTGAIIASPIAWYYLVAPILLFATR